MNPDSSSKRLITATGHSWVFTGVLQFSIQILLETMIFRFLVAASLAQTCTQTHTGKIGDQQEAENET